MPKTEIDIENLIGHLSDLIREVYGDLAKPGVRQVGKALGTVLGLGNTILWPVAWANARSKIALEQNLENYRRKMQEIPEDDVCEVTPELGVPIAEKLAYVTNEELSEMYTELPAKASQIQQANVAHPSFVNIINSLSPDEAIVLRSIRGAQGIPYVEVRLTRTDSNKWNSLHPMQLILPSGAKLRFRNNIPAYISNLEGLGILNIRQDKILATQDQYEQIEELSRRQYSGVDQIPEHKLAFQRGVVEITKFGHLFLQACFTSSS